jgi:hypothetical protein
VRALTIVTPYAPQRSAGGLGKPQLSRTDAVETGLSHARGAKDAKKIESLGLGKQLADGALGGINSKVDSRKAGLLRIGNQRNQAANGHCLQFAKMLTRMRAVASIALALLGLVGCSKKETPVVILASNEDGRPQFDYVGPGMYNYNRNFGSFIFKLGPVSGPSWATGSGELKLGESNDMVLSIQSESDRAFDIRVLGVLTNDNPEAPEEQTIETFHVPPGKQALKLERFIIYTYDFQKR